MKKLIGIAFLALSAASLTACERYSGSCTFDASSAGYTYCEDFLGSEFNTSAAQSNCETAGGTYSLDACTTSGALGVCAVGDNPALNYSYTYYASGSGASATDLAVACGVAGGTFTAE